MGKRDSLEDLLSGTDRRSDKPIARELQEKRLQMVERWKKDPWAYLTAKDVDGRPVVWTKDERAKSVRPFPGHLQYLKELVKILQNEPRVLLDKASQMFTSTIILLFNDWDCAFHPAVGSLLSKTKESEAVTLLRDKVRFPYSQLPEWVQKLRPTSKTPEKRIDYKAVSSTTLAVAENVAVAEGRGMTTTRAMVDEAAFQDAFEDMVQALMPRCQQFIAWTTPHRGSAGATVFFQLLEREAS